MGTDAPATAAECKHTCKDKASCGHLCCKKHLPVATQLKFTQRPVAASAPTRECKHTCRDKLACKHQCCKRHFTRDLAADSQKPPPSANLQIAAQAGRQSRHTTDKHVPSQTRGASSTSLLQVQGKSVSPAKQDPCLKTKPNYHYFVYDLESTGMPVNHLRTSIKRKAPWHIDATV